MPFHRGEFGIFNQCAGCGSGCCVCCEEALIRQGRLPFVFGKGREKPAQCVFLQKVTSEVGPELLLRPLPPASLCILTGTAVLRWLVLWPRLPPQLLSSSEEKAVCCSLWESKAFHSSWYKTAQLFIEKNEGGTAHRNKKCAHHRKLVYRKDATFHFPAKAICVIPCTVLNCNL